MLVSERLNDTDKELCQLVLELENYAIIRIDPSGYITSWNIGAAHIYGYSPKQIRGKHLSFLYPENETSELNEALQSARDSRRHAAEGWRKRQDGTGFYAHVIITTLFDKNRNVIGFAHVTHDITEKKELERENQLLREGLEAKVRQRTSELEVVNNELEAFSYSVSHDLRTPLRAISGYSMMLKEDYQAELNAEGNRLIDTILANTRMMSDLIDDLLTFSKMARLEAVCASVDMSQLVQHCYDKLTAVGNKPEVSLDSLPPCKGDFNMLRQVWYNLLDNAIKYSSRKETPQIKIGYLTNDQYHIYFISDNGTGFDMKYSNKLFGVFQRLHRQDEFEGTGLGLALAKRIVSKHGGDMWAESVQQQGSVFYFSIPKTTYA
ncbi:MAG TPA: ATP-binding protein [Chitinophagaceae bacterium]|nr:ATP-binding protein [Chitinophagaceae bacterium]